jgi:hypothetical protein
MVKELTKEQEELLNEVYYEQKNFVGRDKLFELVKQYEDHPTQAETVQWLVNQEVNQLHIKPKKSSSIASVIIKKPNIYYQCDLVDMGKYASHNKRYIFTLIDVFTKQVFAVAMGNKTENSVFKVIQKMYNQLESLGKSIILLQSNNGAEFINKKFQDFCKDNKIKHITSIPERPQLNGSVERFNGTLKRYIMQDITATGKNEWPLHLQQYIDNYNNNYHSTIKTTPNKASKILKTR